MHTDNSKKFPCEICDKRFDGKAKLKGHIDSVHLKLKRFKCDQCDYECAEKGNLRKHMQKHALENDKFTCEFCSLATTNKRTLDGHIENSHKNGAEGTNNWKNCVLCEFVAKSGYEYKQHIARNHRGQLTCDFCDYVTHGRKCL